MLFAESCALRPRVRAALGLALAVVGCATDDLRQQGSIVDATQGPGFVDADASSNRVDSVLDADADVVARDVREAGLVETGGPRDAEAGVCSTTCDFECTEDGACAEILDVALGQETSCALLSTRSLYCWGNLAMFQGRPATNEKPQRVGQIPGDPTPQAVGNQLALGPDFGCGRASAGDGGPSAVGCWGYNDAGQLGHHPEGGPFVGMSAAVPVKTIEDSVWFRAANHRDVGDAGPWACAYSETELTCWGNGRGPTHVDMVSDGGALLSAWPGAAHLCGVVGERVRCVGRAQAPGPLGTSSEAITAALTLPFPSRVDAGVPNGVLTNSLHTCVKYGASGRSHQQVYCLGTYPGNNSDASVNPVEVTSVCAGSVVVSGGAGAAHTCVSCSDGKINCWGRNEACQIGSGSAPTVVVKQPHVAAQHELVREVWAGAAHSCALSADRKRLYCWGLNGAGQLGGTADVGRTCPEPVRVRAAR
jgi:hypothetical protein